MCPKSCKRFGVKNARGENLKAKKERVWAKMGGVWEKNAFSGMLFQEV